MLIAEAVNLVRMIQEAKQRVFVGGDQSFFSKYDWWMYREISDGRLCKTCNANAVLEDGYYCGDKIRGYFPYLEILDENTISVNEHPNCRCVLVRVGRGLTFPTLNGET